MNLAVSCAFESVSVNQSSPSKKVASSSVAVDVDAQEIHREDRHVVLEPVRVLDAPDRQPQVAPAQPSARPGDPHRR